MALHSAGKGKLLAVIGDEVNNYTIIKKLFNVI